ncbi:MAG: hypothetical protein GQF41_0504 [Candidatus Rifleibacterium amylolyticum]|nr:MAG: hypothetical protein GQF41_0504 [Candidatus Rifleibacterium amylolyticum]
MRLFEIIWNLFGRFTIISKLLAKALFAFSSARKEFLSRTPDSAIKKLISSII